MKSISIRVGTSIGDAIIQGLSIAEEHRLRIVGFKFNGETIKISSGEDPDAIYSSWRKEIERRQKEYRESPEGIAFAKKRAEARAKAEKSAKEGLHRFKRKNEAFWTECKKNNLDGGYGEATLRYASRWAAMMDEHEGEPLDSFAESLSHEADTEGITGFMHGAAVGILSECWIRGDELKAWRHKK